MWVLNKQTDEKRPESLLAGNVAGANTQSCLAVDFLPSRLLIANPSNILFPFLSLSLFGWDVTVIRRRVCLHCTFSKFGSL